METASNSKIEDLRMYIPFIDYLASLDANKYEKLLRIKGWILGNKMFPVEVLKKIEQSIIVQYRNLFLDDSKIPNHIMKIFNEKVETKFETINLCSDDEADEENKKEQPSKPPNSVLNTVKEIDMIELSDGEIIDVDTEVSEPSSRTAELHKEKFSETGENISTIVSPTAVEIPCDIRDSKGNDNVLEQTSDEETELLLKRIDNICNKVQRNENVSIEMSSDELIEGEPGLFTRRPKKQLDKQLFSEKELNNKCERVLSREDSSENKILNNAKTELGKKFKSQGIEMDPKKGFEKQQRSENEIELSTKSNDMNVIDLSSDDEREAPLQNTRGDSPDNVDSSNKNNFTAVGANENVGICASDDLERMDVNALETLFRSLVDRDSDLDLIIKELISKESQTSQKDPPVLPDNGNNNITIINNTHKNGTPSSVNNNWQFKEACIQQSIPIRVTEAIQEVPQMQYMQPHSSNNSYPIYNINGRKINLNDPRIRQHLKNIQNSPLLSLGPQVALSSMAPHIEKHNVTRNLFSGSREPLTYGEHRRRNAEKIEEAKRRKQALRHFGTEESTKKCDGVVEKHDAVESIEQISTIKRDENKKRKRKRTSFSDGRSAVAKKICPNTNESTHNTAQDPSFEPRPKDKNACDPNIASSPKNGAPPKSKAKTKAMVRLLKELDCDVIGFAQFSTPGPRKSSETARSAIAKQLGGQQIDGYNSNLSRINPESKTKPIRRSSFNATGELETKLAMNPPLIKQRRKTCTEINITNLISPDNLQFNNDIADRVFPNTDTWECDVISDASSSDTAIFESYQNKKAKADALKKQPIVLLQRLTEEEINYHLLKGRPVQPEEIFLNVELVQAGARELPADVETNNATMKKSKILPNTDDQMTEKNTSHCVLCKSKPANLINHYIRNHKTEPYVSRLTTRELEDLQINCPFALPCTTNTISGRFVKYKVQCVFCSDELVDQFINFYTHYSTHTGEYAFQCYNCEIKKPFRADIQSHQHHVKACRNARIQKLYVYPTDRMVIYLHCCKLCNFVQLNEANVYKHLRDHHLKRNDEPDNVQKYIAAAINDAEIVNELMTENDGEPSLQNADLTYENEHNPYDSEEKEIFIKQECLPQEEEMEGSHTAVLRRTPPSLHVPNNQMTMIPISNLSESHMKDFVINDLSSSKPDQRNEEDSKKDKLSIKEEQAAKGKYTNTASEKKETICDYDPKTIPFIYREYPIDVSYFGLFKCAQKDCFFSTDEETQILDHFNSHSGDATSLQNSLNCTYCRLERNECSNAFELVRHIQMKHGRSCFQCPKCSYRSCVPGNVSIHYSTFHSIKFGHNFVYKCVEYPFTPEEHSKSIEKLMSENVTMLPCPYCSLRFFALSSMKNHLQELHSIENVNDSVFLKEFACIHCQESCITKKDMQIHMALEHADKLPIACRRKLMDPALGDSFHNLMVENVAEPVESINIRNPYTFLEKGEHQTAVKEVNKSNIEDNLDAISFQNPDEDKHESVQRDLKPDISQLEQIAEESLRIVLDKLTKHTGIPPDQLYHCPIETCGGFFSTYVLWARHMSIRHNTLLACCPHRPCRKELNLSDFQLHFEQHCRHLFVCFHCSYTSASEDALISHFKNENHNNQDIENFQFESVRFNVMYSYRIIIAKSSFVTRLEFMQTMRDQIAKRLDELVDEERSKLLFEWLVPQNSEWLEHYTVPNTQGKKNCLNRNCGYISTSDDDLFSHMESSHSVADTCTFKCNKCPIVIENFQNWQEIAQHVQLHSFLYVCSVCNSAFFGRLQLCEHINQKHNSRDVPYLKLRRSGDQIFVSLGVIFPAGRKSFSTTRTCFFCNATNLPIENVCKHLKRAHNIFLQYYCSLCNDPVKQLRDLETHFSDAHGSAGQIKASCALLSHNIILPRSLNPFCLDISHDYHGLDNELTICSSMPVIEVPCNSTNYESSKSCVNSLAQSVTVKCEVLEEDDRGFDSSVEILDDDDIICSEEIKTYLNESDKIISGNQKLRCINVSNLKNQSNSHSNMSIPVSAKPSTTLSSELKPCKGSQQQYRTALTSGSNHISNYNTLNNIAYIKPQATANTVAPGNMVPASQLYPKPQEQLLNTPTITQRAPYDSYMLSDHITKAAEYTKNEAQHFQRNLRLQNLPVNDNQRNIARITSQLPPVIERQNIITHQQQSATSLLQNCGHIDGTTGGIQLQENVPQLQIGVQQLQGVAPHLQVAALQLHGTTPQIQRGIQQIKSSILQSQSSASQLQSGLEQIQGATPQLQGGSQQVRGNVAQPQIGILRLQVGTSQLQNSKTQTALTTSTQSISSKHLPKTQNSQKPLTKNSPLILQKLGTRSNLKIVKIRPAQSKPLLPKVQPQSIQLQQPQQMQQEIQQVQQVKPSQPSEQYNQMQHTMFGNILVNVNNIPNNSGQPLSQNQQNLQTTRYNRDGIIPQVNTLRCPPGENYTTS